MIPASVLRQRQIKKLQETLLVLEEGYVSPAQKRAKPFWLAPATMLMCAGVTAAKADSMVARKSVVSQMAGASALLKALPKAANPGAHLMIEAFDAASYVLCAESYNRIADRWDRINALCDSFNQVLPAIKVLTKVKATG